MVCPKCGMDNNKVILHNVYGEIDGKDFIGRHRKCLNCEEMFETVERWDGRDNGKNYKEEKKIWFQKIMWR